MLLAASQQGRADDNAEYEGLKLVDVELAIGHDQIAPLRAGIILIVDRQNPFSYQPGPILKAEAIAARRGLLSDSGADRRYPEQKRDRVRKIGQGADGQHQRQHHSADQDGEEQNL